MTIEKIKRLIKFLRSLSASDGTWESTKYKYGRQDFIITVEFELKRNVKDLEYRNWYLENKKYFCKELEEFIAIVL